MDIKGTDVIYKTNYSNITIAELERHQDQGYVITCEADGLIVSMKKEK